MPEYTVPTTLLVALAEGLADLAAHQWGQPGDRTSLMPHYRRDAERFLLPRLREATDG